MSKELLDTLDALNNERPAVIYSKRKHFGDDLQYAKGEKLDRIRLNTERDRITRFRKVTLDQSGLYYTLLENLTKLLEQRKQRQ